MSMLEYIRAVKIGLRDQHGFTPDRVENGEPLFNHIPDGEYPMTIDGKRDRVRIVNGYINCCNFEG